MPDKMKVLIVDDEALARQLLRNYLNVIPGVEIAGECENGFEALKMVQELKPDLLFLDVQMPKVDGFELLEVLDPRPEIIFTTAFDQFAIRAFELNAVDYLLKPFSKERLVQAVEKALQRIGTPSPGTPSLLKHLVEEKHTIERVITRLGSRITVIPVEKIWYIEAADDYVMIFSELGNHLKEKTMKYFEDHLDETQFVRIHRSHIINLSYLQHLEQQETDSYKLILKNGQVLPVSKTGLTRLKATL